MKIQIISDIHNEFGMLNVPVTPDENKRVLVIAGDLGIAVNTDTYIPFLSEMSERFQDIIYIPGNHEYYKSSFVRARDKIKDAIVAEGGMENVHFVNNKVVKIYDVSFVCSTMWASYDKHNPLTLNAAQSVMNDHRLIRTGTKQAPYVKKFSSTDAYEEFLTSINFIFPAIVQEKDIGQKVCVVTHHSPSPQSIPEIYRTGPYSNVNGAYASDLESDIIETKPNLWIHGHTHTSFNYTIEGTQILCNPRGYYNHGENVDFDVCMIVEL